MSIVVTGSLAYDYIMRFPGAFKEHILPEKMDSLSVAFLVNTLERVRGGVAGNIAYNLALLGERPQLFGAVGQDFGDYRAWLDARGVDTSRLITIENEFTSSCFITTDEHNHQIVSFYPGAMSQNHTLSLRHLELTAKDMVLISASSPESMDNLARECQELHIPYIFDPGKQTPRLEASVIRSGLKGARVLIGNDYEFGMMAKKLDMTEDDLIVSAPITVITRAEHGSTIYLRGEDSSESYDYTATTIPAVNVAEVRDPTGAGDAYLAGLVFGIVHNLSWEETGRIAALTAAYAVEHYGPQEHAYSLADFGARYQETFGKPFSI
ncbi:MAG: carbohydrate kinase family protein [Chloroflexaceae bacterium]|nr:carbohydrate kinase family protein [Chloroflexaceae bacterium]